MVTASDSTGALLQAVEEVELLRCHEGWGSCLFGGRTMVA